MKRRYVANLKFPTLIFFSFRQEKSKCPSLFHMCLVLECVWCVYLGTIVKIVKIVKFSLGKERKKREDKSGYLRYQPSVFGLWYV